jgi:hypothetical protein
MERASYARNLIPRVRNNGKGAAPEIAANGKEGHFGVIGMRERAAKLRVTLSSAPAWGLSSVSARLRETRSESFDSRDGGPPLQTFWQRAVQWQKAEFKPVAPAERKVQNK